MGNRLNAGTRMTRSKQGRRHPANRCPTCGGTASGRFCGSCGSPLKGARCPACSATIEPGSKYCHNCSHRFGTSRGPIWIPYAVAGVAVAVVVAIAIGTGVGPEPTSVRLPQGLGTLPPPGGVSNAVPGSPRAQADAHFDRAMRAFEGGDPAEAASAGQIALTAYRLLPERDADLRFHMGLLHEIAGNREAMLAQADSIQIADPDHLLGLLIRARVYGTDTDPALLRETYRRLLELYDGQMATSRPEYQAHGRLLEVLREEARRALSVE